MISIDKIEYEDTGCRYYSSCLNCGEPDECKFAKRTWKATPEEKKARKRELNREYQQRCRERKKLLKEQGLI